MKKTIKRSLVLLSLITALLVCAFAFTASAEEKKACMDDDGVHLDIFYEYVYYEPTCTQNGYVIKTCPICGHTAKDYTQGPKKHNYAVSYEKDGEGYKRKYTCQNTEYPCTRDPKTGEEVYNTFYYDDAVYYTVDFVNECESPDNNDNGNFNKNYFVQEDRTTWLAESFITKEYIASTKTNANAKNELPAYEFIEENGKIRLYVKEGEKAPAFAGSNLPVRVKDAGLERNGSTPIGRYSFYDWIAEDGEMAYNAHLTQGTITSYKDVAITKNTTFYAYFAGDENVTVSVSFYDGNGSALSEGVTIPYASSISYSDFGNKTPTKASNERCYYRYNGWTLVSNKKTVYGISEKITLYASTSAFAHFEQINNEYTVRFVNNGGTEFEKAKSEGVIYGGTAEGVQEITENSLVLPRDKKFMYNFTGNWKIKEYNGEKVTGNYTVNPRNFSVPHTVTVQTADGSTKEIKPQHGDEVVLAPVYSSQHVLYYIPINIITVRFEEEDLFEDNSMIRSDILDDFVINVTDANGQYIAGGRTDENGRFVLTTTYADVLYITADTINSSKYHGEHVLRLELCTTPEEIESYETHGIAIAPSVTQEWLDGMTKPCTCMCHGLLGPILIRIYNILYRMFNYKYICCDDLFITHAGIIAYER